MNIFTVYDSKAEAYLTPFFMKTAALAIREFEAMANDPNSNFGKYPADYTLMHLGEFNEDSAEITTHTTPVSLGVAMEFVKQQSLDLDQMKLDIQGA